MGFCSCTVKFILIIFNLTCAIIGLAILALGAVANSRGNSFRNVISGQLTTAAICFIVLGAVIFLIAFFGCCGALREDTCMIQTYAVILLSILLIEIAIGVTAFVFKSNVEEELRFNYESFFSHYPQHKREIDDIQSSLECCGFSGPNYWDTITPKQSIPNSCCKKQRDCDYSNSYQDGCMSKTRHYLKKMFNVIGGVALGVAVVELLGVIFAFYVAGSIKRQERRGYV